MKNMFTLYAGIVLLVTIPISGCCDSAKDCGSKKIDIYLKSVVIDGVKHLQLRDSNGNTAMDTLTTIVHAGDRVVWKKDKDSGIKKIVNIKSKEKRNIFKNDPLKKFLSKEFQMDIPCDAKPERQKYDIEYKLKDNSLNIIDPYLRIPED